jgi:16S rRNA (guanine1207-N2)-methyltransferase
VDLNVADRASPTEALLVDAIREEAARTDLAGVLLIGMQARSTVQAVNGLLDAERVTLLHLDRAPEAVGCGLGNREWFIGDGPGPAGGFGVVAVNVEGAKSYRLLREIVAQAARLLEGDGVVLVAGPRRGGAEVAAHALEEAFTSVTVVSYRKGHRVYRASGRRASAHGDRPAPGSGSDRGDGRGVANADEGELTVQLRGRALRLIRDERIFARGGLDAATRMLADVFEVRPGAAVLDLGCGNGVLGILSALLDPTGTVTLVDSDPLAVRVARRNADLNGAANVTVHLSDVLHHLPGQTFDVVLMNPPFHRGRIQDRSLAERFITEAGAALRPGGSIFVVCNRFLAYEPTLERAIGRVREIAGDRQFKVLTATRR